MADWDADSPRLRQNLVGVLRDVRDRAARREIPTVEDARRWQRDTMAGLTVPDRKYVGRFRGEPGLEITRVWVDEHEGAPPERVASELAAFEQTLQTAVAALDARYPRAETLDTDGLAAVIDLCAWAHAEWVRIHPFANGNGRTARIWANALLMRYGLPPVIRLRPRPDGGYGDAGAAATRFGIYKRVRQHAAAVESTAPSSSARITPHVFRHSTAVHLLEAGVEVNVIRGWLGHVSLETTNRYAEITVRMKEAAMKLCEPPTTDHAPRKPAWRDDAALLSWLASL